MSKTSILVRSLVSVVIITLFFTILDNFIIKEDNLHPNYRGKEVFTTESEYQRFKLEVSKPGIEWTKMQALASDPPIIVVFDIFATPDFNYGHRDYSTRNLGMGLLILPLLFLLGITWLPKD